MLPKTREIELSHSWYNYWIILCLLSCLKSSVCLIGGVTFVAWPLSFPAFVYLGEGITLFFWQVAVVAAVITVMMLIKMSPDINEWRQKYIQKIYCTNPKWLEHLHSWLNSNQRKTLTITLLAVCILGQVAMYKMQVEIKYVIGVALLIIGFLCGIYVNDYRRNNRVLPTKHYEEIRPNMPLSLRPGTHSPWLQILDFARERGFSPLRYGRSPPPSYQEATGTPLTELLKPSKYSPACRMSLFQR